MPDILVVSGSPGDHSKTAKLAEYVTTRLNSIGMGARHLRVRDLPAHALLAARTSNSDIAAALRLVEDAEGLVFVTPTYKASFSGLIKVFIDMLPQFALREKAILPLATGGTMAHVLMLDYALRPVLQSLGARHAVQGHFMIESALDLSAPALICDARQKDLLDQAIGHFSRAILGGRKAA